MDNEPQKEIQPDEQIVTQQPKTQIVEENKQTIQKSQEPQKTEEIIQRKQQNVMINQITFLQSQIITPEVKIQNNSHDQIPIGGGNKFQMSQFPQQGQSFKPVPKKPAAKKASKRITKEQLPNNQNVNMQTKSKTFNEDAPLSKTNTQPLDQLPVGGTNKNQFTQFDQKPISKGNSAFNMSQFPQGQQQPVQQKEYPMLVNLKSKAVKQRLIGMQALLKLLQQNPDHPDINQVDVKPMIKETAPANLQKGLQVLKIWIQKGKRWGDDQVKNAIQNGLAKNITKKTTLQICDMMYQQNANTVEGSLLIGMKSKIAKNIALYVSVIYQLLAIYGIKKMKYLKPFIPQIVKILNDKKDIAIKTQCLTVLKQSYKWLGKDVISPMLGDLKQNLKKQLDSFWDSFDQTTVMKAPKGQQNGQQGDSKKKKKVDAYDLSQAVDVFKKYNQKWAETVINAPKWNQKTKMLEQFVKAATVPKLANTQFRHISQMIKRLINDSNFNVVIWDLKVLGCLSRGLRRHFSNVVKNNFSQVLGKFRDKKTQMIQQTFSTLSDFMYCITLDDVMDDIKEGLQDKAPNMKVNVLNWISKFIETKAQQKGQVPEKVLDSLKAFFGLFQKLLNDGNVEVRDCMARNIFKMKLVVGDQFFNALQSKMNKNLISKASTETKGSAKGKQPVKKQKSPQKQMNKTGSSFKKIDPKKQQMQKSMLKTQTIPKKQQKKPSQPQLKLQRFQQISYDDCCVKLVQMGFPQQQIKNIKAPGAKQRSNVFNILKTESFDLLTTFTVIKQLFKDWKQVNLLMNKELVAFIEQKSQQIQKPQLVILIPFMIEKIGDTKFVQPLFRAIEKICHKIPGVFIVGYFIQKIKAQDFKKPKLNSDVCTCICKIIEIVSASNIPLRETIMFANECFKNQFAKKGGLQLLKKIYSYVGQQIKIYLQAQTYTAIQAQLKKTKMASQQQKKPKIQFFGQAKKSQKTVVNLLENKPKIDITQDVLKYLPKMNDNGNWQNRKQSAQAIINLINDNFGRVTIQCMNDLMNTLKLRINDSNKQLIKVFMQLAGVLFPVLNDKQLKLFTKPFVLAIADGLSDKMQANKKQANLTLNKIGQVVGKQQLLAMLAPYLQTDKQSRIQIISIMLSNQQFLNKTDMKDFAKGITNCLCDKNKDIRNTAEKLFEKVYERIGIDIFRNIAKNQKPAVTKDLNLIYDKYQKDRSSNIGSQNYISKANSPSKQKQLNKSNIKPPTASAHKKSLQKNTKNHTSTIQIQHEDIEPITTNSRIIRGAQNTNNYSSINQMNHEPQKITTYVQGDEIFAPLKILQQFHRQRLERPSWRFDQIKQQDQEFVKDQISLLFRIDVGKKMLSFNSKRTSDAALILIKLCKDINYQNFFKETYDLLIQWTVLRLWGGNPSLMYLAQIIPPIFSILQKRNAVFSDPQVDLVILLIRQYLLSAYMNQSKVSDSLHITVKSLISRSSGEKVIRRILRQFSFQLTSIHKHLKKQANIYYRDGLSQIIKIHLIDFIGNQQMLEEASKIKQLRSDSEFVDILYKKFHEGVLNSFGFRNFVTQTNFSTTNINNLSSVNQVHVSNNSNPYVPRIQRVGNVQKQKSTQKKLSNNAKVTNMQQLNNMGGAKSQIIPNKTTLSSNTMNLSSIQNIPKVIIENTLAQKSQKVVSTTLNKMIPNDFQNNFESIKNNTNTSTNSPNEIDLSLYPAPHPVSPLGKNLAKLYPYNQQTIRFFTQLFSEHGQKIANQLTTHAKIIFASILKSVMIMFETRYQQLPQKIVNQMNLFQQCIKCKYIIRNIDELLYTGINFALRQLVYEDQNKVAIQKDLLNKDSDFKVDQFGKVINGAMLRILQNSNSQQVTNTLIRIHNQYVKCTPKSMKTFCLIVKCTTRASQSYTSQMKIDGVVQFFVLINEYFILQPPEVSLEQFQLSTKQKPKPEQNFLNAIKSIILELGKVLNSDIWQIYQRAMQHAKYQDHFIAVYLQSLKIKQQQRRPDPRMTNNSRENQEIKKISQLLSKNKTFETGILHLKKFCNQNMSFSPVQYFTSLGYDQKFIAMVMNSLEGKQRRTPRKDSNDGKYNKSKSPINNTSQQQQQNISEKIKKLKEKFDQIKPNNSTPNVSQKVIQDVMQGRKQSQQSGQASKDQRAAQIKRRIDQMKSRLNQNFDSKPR